MTDMVLAVPMSKTIMGLGYLSVAATAPTTRSAPNWPGSSILMLSPVLIPAPTTRGFFSVTASTARHRTLVSSLTTQERTAPSTAEGST